MDEAAQLAINQHDSSALVVLGKNGWVRMFDSVNRAVSIALDDGGGPQAIKTLEAALRIGFYHPIRCRQIFLFCGNGLKGTPELWYEDPEVTHTTVFELCSWQPPDCETAATMLRVLLRAAKQGDAWPRTASYVVVYLRAAFMVALKAAARGGTSVRLRVLDVWMECCESLLVPKGHHQ